MALPLSSDAKWIIGTMLVIASVVISISVTSVGLGRTVATRTDLEGLAAKTDLEDLASKTDLEGLATSDDVETLRVQLDDTTQRLDAAVDRLDGTVTRLDETVDRLDDTVDRLDGTVDRLGDTNDGLRTLVGTTLPAIFACMVELDTLRAAERWGNGPPVAGDVDRVAMSEICDRLRRELAEVQTPLLPQLPD